MKEALTGDLTFLECTVYLQSCTQVSKLLYFIGVGFGGLEAMNSMAGFGGVGRMGELYRGAMTSSMERDFGRGDIGINRGFGDSFGRLGRAGCILFSFCRSYS